MFDSSEENRNKALEGIEITQQICHFLGSRLELWHGRRITANDLLDEAAIGLTLANGSETGADIPIRFRTMASSTIDLENSVALNWVPDQRQDVASVRITCRLGSVNPDKTRYDDRQN